MFPIFITLRRRTNGEPERIEVGAIRSYRARGPEGCQDFCVFFRGADDTAWSFVESPAEIDALIEAERQRVVELMVGALVKATRAATVESKAGPDLRLGNARRIDGVWWLEDQPEPLYLREDLENLAGEIAGRCAGRMVTSRRLADAIAPEFEIPVLMAELAEKVGPFAEETPDGWKIPLPRPRS